MTSESLPWIGGMIPPPKIIMIKNAAPCLVYFPNPAIDKLKIDGHMIEQNKPPLNIAYTATGPVVKTPITIEATPNRLNNKSVFAGLYLLKYAAPICTSRQMKYIYKGAILY